MTSPLIASAPSTATGSSTRLGKATNAASPITTTMTAAAITMSSPSPPAGSEDVWLVIPGTYGRCGRALSAANPDPGSVVSRDVSYAGSMAIIGCPSCGAKNRVGPVTRGVPRCARCKTMLPWLVDASTDSFEAEAGASVPVVVDLWAPWCGPCRMVAPVLEDLAARHAGHLKVVKVNVDEQPALGARFGARSIPLLVVLRGGQEVDRIVGALPARALEARLAPVLA